MRAEPGGAALCAAAAIAPAADWEHEKQVSQEAAAAAAADRAIASLTVAARRRRRSSEDGRATDVAKFRQTGLEMMVVEGAPSLSPWLLLLRVSTVELYGFISARVLNPIPTSQGRNQPLYERHVTSGCNFV